MNRLRNRKLLKLQKPYPSLLINLSLLLIPSTVPLVDPDSYATDQRLFMREVTILKSLNGYPRIPKFIDYWDENQQSYLLQEYIPGKTLDEELNHGKKSENDVVKFLAEILEILRFVHEKGIIHRDLNPRNIIRHSLDDQLVLIDFGAGAIKKVVTTTTYTQTSRTKIYTPGYAPTEQMRGHPQYNSDIYALGVTAIQMMTCIEPQNLAQDYNGELVWREHANVSTWLANILNNMVCENYKNRYKSVEKVLIELQKHNVCQTKTLILPTNVDLFEGEQTRNQTDAIVFFLMTLISLFAIFYTAGVFSINQDIKLLKNQSSVLEKVN